MLLQNYCGGGPIGPGIPGIPGNAAAGLSFTKRSLACRLTLMVNCCPPCSTMAPASLNGLIADIKHLTGYKNNAVYGQLVLNMHGVDQQRNAMPNLPLSRVAIMAENPPANLYPLFNSVKEVVPAGAIVEQGGQQFTIKVSRHANERFVKLKPAAAFPGMPGMPGPMGPPPPQ